MEDLGDPEEPDPGRHLVEILLEGVDNLCELRRVKVPSLLYCDDQVWDNEAALMQAKSDGTKIALDDILE